jgi:heme a synthase
MDRPVNPWLHRFAVVCAVATMGLIGLGGVVTSKGAGMAVPDWPTSYGYNMFWLPVDQWIGGIFYEHTHRLYAAFIGLLTTILAAWLWVRETSGRARWAGLTVILVLVAMLGHRGSGNATGGAASIPMHFKVLAVLMPVLVLVGVAQCVRTRGAWRWLGLTAFFAVIFQGILGGLRVALYQDALGIFHATLAQLFLVLLCALALVTSSRWQGAFSKSVQLPSRHAWVFGGLTALMLGQLILGASMRHQHAGLAVPDFPLAHGRLWPATDAASIELYNHRRSDVREFKPITAGQIHLHMTHRIVALALVAGVLMAALRLRRDANTPAGLRQAATGWAALVLAQAALGAATVWTNKAADVATLHVVLGAVSLAWGALMSLTALRLARAHRPVAQRQDVPENEIAARARPAVQGA